MIDANKQRDEIISHLETALGIANELYEQTLAFLIERAIDEARSGLFPPPGRPRQSR